VGVAVTGLTAGVPAVAECGAHLSAFWDIPPGRLSLETSLEVSSIKSRGSTGDDVWRGILYKVSRYPRVYVFELIHRVMNANDLRRAGWTSLVFMPS